jgi:protein-disulfide isomerase-like protein with CxxC motif
MLFLLNTEMLDLQPETEALTREAVEERRATPSLFSSVQLAQKLYFQAGGFRNADQRLVRRVAAAIGLASEANAALFVFPQTGASAPQDVAVRLGAAPLTTMAYLWALQKRGPLTAGVVNRDVWGQVAAEADQGRPSVTA